MAGKNERGGLLDRVLERWGEPPPRARSLDELDRLHRAFLREVPFENVTKLLKAARTGASPASIRTPVEFWDEHLRWGSGGTCFAATFAYQFLLRYLGFTSRLLFCHLPAELRQAHAALLVETDTGDVLVDVGYALPLPVPLPEGGALRRKTPYYDLELRSGPGEEWLVFSEDDRGQRFRYRFQARPVSEAEFRTAWGRTFRPDAPYMRRLALGRFVDGTRYLFREPDQVYEIRREGERSTTLEGPHPRALADRFGLPEPMIQASLAALDHLLGKDRTPSVP
jgi:arylamine N-acetyltransferase